MQESLLKIRYFEIGLSKSIKKVEKNNVIKNKRGLELVTSRSSGH